MREGAQRCSPLLFFSRNFVFDPQRITLMQPPPIPPQPFTSTECTLTQRLFLSPWSLLMPQRAKFGMIQMFFLSRVPFIRERPPTPHYMAPPPYKKLAPLKRPFYFLFLFCLLKTKPQKIGPHKTTSRDQPRSKCYWDCSMVVPRTFSMYIAAHFFQTPTALPPKSPVHIALSLFPRFDISPPAHFSRSNTPLSPCRPFLGAPCG